MTRPSWSWSSIASPCCTLSGSSLSYEKKVACELQYRLGRLSAVVLPTHLGGHAALQTSRTSSGGYVKRKEELSMRLSDSTPVMARSCIGSEVDLPTAFSACIPASNHADAMASSTTVELYTDRLETHLLMMAVPE